MTVVHIVQFRFKDGTSPEAVSKDGIQYAFVMHFETPEDRDYYVKTDPVHQNFVKTNGPLIEKAIVVDYTVGEF
ncbi:uncharacterized protein PG998_012954 [Apiospora kogelbergensis]|uniref:uncharacterized protein n=1 Tax=Apiospora kogelbergensis TaxID=1337665 RepID=UPI00312EBBDD